MSFSGSEPVNDPVTTEVEASSVTDPPVGTDKVGASFALTSASIFTVKTFEVVAIPSVAEILTFKV